MTELQRHESDRVSTFRTAHRIDAYAEFRSVEEYQDLTNQAARAGRQVLILGNGSNILFRRRRIKTAVLKNKLPRLLETLDGNHHVRVSSTVPVAMLLKHCQKHCLDSCYYLASVPATVGGALAMNAGRGRNHGLTIYDFVRSVRWLEGGEVKESSAENISREYRWTGFTGLSGRLILDAEFEFPPADGDRQPIRERIEWSKQEQDHEAPNCGSVFKEAHFGMMRRLRGVRIGQARYSTKTTNWLSNNGQQAWPLLTLIRVAQLGHLLICRRAKLELIDVK